MHQMPKQIKILSLEAKDLYNSNNLEYDNPTGYSIRTPNGEIFTKRFINALDYSLDLLKLSELYTKITRQKYMTFMINNRVYTQHVINVKFKYSMKDYNKSGNLRYVKEGYQYKDIELKDHICIKNGKVIAIEVDTPFEKPCNEKYLAPYFYIENGMYKTKGNFKVTKNKSELRDYLYKNGFVCDGIKFVRWKRSAGSSRVGKCLFINEILYNRIHKWEMCGLKVNDGDEIDLAALEAYISLTSSSIINTMEIQPDNFLVIDDCESEFEDEVCGVEFEDGKLVSKFQKYKISNSLFDGESLIDESLIPEEYKKYGMLLLRNRFFKSACFNTNVQKWFEDNNITDISQLNGFTLAKDIKDIKIVTTPSSIKYCKFGKIIDWLKIIEPKFGIVKHEKPTHFFNGRRVQCHYQLLNTLPLSEKEVQDFLAPTFDYINKVRNDPDILRYHIKYPYIEDLNNIELNPLNDKNDIIFKLLGINSEFSKTKLYNEFKKDLSKSLIRELKQGHVLINGNYSTLLGNGLEMLKHSIGKFNGVSEIGYGNIHSTRFEYDKTILGTRSPHICSGNVLIVKNVANDEIDRYFNLSPEIVYVNAINDNIQQKLNGADYDSDTILLTDDKILIDAALRIEGKFAVPTNFVTAKKIKRYYTAEQKSDLDVKTSINKIGEDVNLSQQLNSLMWDNINKGQTIEENQELYSDICKLAVLSNIEIDKAKKEYEVNTGKEIQSLKNKYQIINDDGKVVKPMFFKTITTENGYKLNEKIIYEYFETPMDYLQKDIKKHNFRKHKINNQEFLPFRSIVKPIENKCNSRHYFSGQSYKQAKAIVDIIKEEILATKRLYAGYSMKGPEEKVAIRNQVVEIKEDCINTVNKKCKNPMVIHILIDIMDKEPNISVEKRLFDIFFSTGNSIFYDLLVNNENEICELIETQDGDIQLYDYKFIKKSITDCN